MPTSPMGTARRQWALSPAAGLRRARGPGACFKVPPARTVRRGGEPNSLGEICPALLTTVPVVFLMGGICVTPPPTAWPVAPQSEALGRAGALPAVVGSPYVGVYEAPARSCGGFVRALRDHRSVRRGHRRGRMRLLLGLLVPPPRPQHLPLGVPLRASVSIGGTCPGGARRKSERRGTRSWTANGGPNREAPDRRLRPGASRLATIARATDRFAGRASPAFSHLTGNRRRRSR
jgi:hypothetical protein